MSVRNYHSVFSGNSLHLLVTIQDHIEAKIALNSNFLGELFIPLELTLLGSVAIGRARG
ncbi:hypothetical protein BH20ACI3_BH20ACI3_39030 [soil metagenome]